MEKNRIRYKPLVFVALLLVSIYSCSGYKQDKYVDQIKKKLSVYDSVNSILIAKYSSRSVGNSTLIYPSREGLSAHYFRIYDSSIYNFCTENDIGYIRIYSAVRDSLSGAVDITYYLEDPNYQYIYQSVGIRKSEVFENTRVLVIPITKNWTFQYEKPNF
jgi:hypothetical protein